MAKEKKNGKACGNCAGVMWWTTLLVAVLAVPTAGAIAALALVSNEFAQMGVFILACWLSVWLGMKLMQKANEAQHNKK